jgi:hypothetical protein
VDAVSHGLQVVIPREAVGDRDAEAHRRSLADIDLKYGDVAGEADVVEWLSGDRLRTPRQPLAVRGAAAADDGVEGS